MFVVKLQDSTEKTLLTYIFWLYFLKMKQWKTVFVWKAAGGKCSAYMFARYIWPNVFAKYVHKPRYGAAGGNFEISMLTAGKIVSVLTFC